MEYVEKIKNVLEKENINYFKKMVDKLWAYWYNICNYKSACEEILWILNWKQGILWLFLVP